MKDCDDEASSHSCPIAGRRRGRGSRSAAMWCMGKQQEQQNARSARARSRTSRCRCSPRARSVADVPVYLDGVGTTRALNTVTVRAAGRRAAHRDRLPRRPGREARRRAGRDRSAHLSGAVRPGGGQEGAGRGDARQRAARSRALHPARRDQFRIDSSRPTRRGRWWRSSKRRCRRDQAAIDNAARDARATPPSSRRSTAAPASAWSTKATSCAPATPTGIVVITQIQPISVLFTLPQQQLAQVNKALRARARCRSTRWRPTTRPSIDRGKLQVVDNQVDQTTGTIS